MASRGHRLAMAGEVYVNDGVARTMAKRYGIHAAGMLRQKKGEEEPAVLEGDMNDKKDTKSRREIAI